MSRLAVILIAACQILPAHRPQHYLWKHIVRQNEEIAL
jgi:hypothetical protein